MKITRHGNMNNIVTFECRKCGCIFEAEKDEYWEENGYIMVTYPPRHRLYTCCPECRKVVTQSYAYETILDSVEVKPYIRKEDVLDWQTEGLNN